MGEKFDIMIAFGNQIKNVAPNSERLYFEMIYDLFQKKLLIALTKIASRKMELTLRSTIGKMKLSYHHILRQTRKILTRAYAVLIFSGFGEQRLG